MRGGVGEGMKKVLITGVSKGLGRALAIEMAKLGHIIIGCSRTQNDLHLLEQHLRNISPHNHFLLNIDVSCNDSVKEMARIVVDKIGVPDIIVNNAGVINKQGKIWEIPKEEFDNVIDINIKGTTNVLRHFIPLMTPKNQGIIVNMSAIMARIGVPMASPYCSSKWAIEGLSKSVAKEMPDGMTIITLDPGIVNTQMLFSLLGDIASQFQTPEKWAKKAAPMILNLTGMDNGASLTVDDPGVLPF
ncbi:NADPH-dependent pterin aldehyde reductase-like [Benincasa hispida]|uniref:NADPH-dependent pterin aldehyde reductase-like n=1 Tax=Benincasa hispida TaxID=102211 RepID=UPI0018FF48B3|nr:NADPH-dependent pterin aldehyde reductase-like [Benincasa hispida]